MLPRHTRQVRPLGISLARLSSSLAIAATMALAGSARADPGKQGLVQRVAGIHADAAAMRHLAERLADQQAGLGLMAVDAVAEELDLLSRARDRP